MGGSHAQTPGVPETVRSWDEDLALRAILAGTAGGEPLFRSLVRYLAIALGSRHAWVTEFLRPSARLRALACWSDGCFREDVEYGLAGTPCERVLHGRDLVHHPSGVRQLYPRDAELEQLDAESYLGAPLEDRAGDILGLLAVIDDRPMPAEPRGLAIFRIFAARAAMELRNIRAQRQIEALTRRTESLQEAIRAGQVATGTMRQIEREHIRRVLAECNWVIEGERGAAPRLDLKPSTLRSRMKKLGIQKP